MALLIDIILIIVILTSVFTDLRSGKIYNKVTFPAWIVGVLLNVFLRGASGVLFSLKGGIGLILLFFPIFALGWLKAGDVKLFGVIGAMKGLHFGLHAGLFSIVADGIVAFFLLLREGKIKDFGGKISQTFFFLLTLGKVRFEGNRTLAFPYSLGILIGTGATYFLFWQGKSLW